MVDNIDYRRGKNIMVLMVIAFMIIIIVPMIIIIGLMILIIVVPTMLFTERGELNVPVGILRGEDCSQKGSGDYSLKMEVVMTLTKVMEMKMLMTKVTKFKGMKIKMVMTVTTAGVVPKRYQKLQSVTA